MTPISEKNSQQQGLYRSDFEHDACGVGFIVDIKGRKSHSIVSQGLEILRNLTHRGAVGADPLQGDGAGILIQIPDELYRQERQTHFRHDTHVISRRFGQHHRVLERFLLKSWHARA